MANSFPDALEQAVERTIGQNNEEVERWMSNQPGAWGALAGKGVMTCRQLLGRPLSDDERRAVWQALWDRMVVLRSQAED